MRSRLVAAIALAVCAFGLTLTVARAKDPAAQCTQNMNNHFGIAAPWDGACWAGAFENITTFASNSVATTVTRWVMSGAVETTDLLLTQFGSNSGTTPSFSSPWFQQVYYGDAAHRGGSFPGQAGALAIAEMLAVPLVVLTILAGVVRGKIGKAVTTVLVRLPLIVVLCFAFITILQRCFGVVDALSGWVVGGTIADFQSWTTSFNPNNVGADFAVVIICIVIILTTLIAYIELFVRSAMIYLVVAFVPIIAIATLWQGSRTALKRTVEFLAVMTCSKLIMAFAFMIGAGALTAGDAQNFAPLLVGAVIFAVIAFAPFSLFALIPLVEAAAAGGVVGMGAGVARRLISPENGRPGVGHGAVRAVSRTASTVGNAPSQARSALDAGARLMEPVAHGLRVAGAAAVAAAAGRSRTAQPPATPGGPAGDAGARPGGATHG